MQIETVKVSKEAASKLAELGCSASDVLYSFLELPQPESTHSPYQQERSIDVLIWQGTDSAWYALGTAHPYLCSRAASRDEAASCVRNRIASIDRQLSSTELALVRSVARGIQATYKLPGKDGVVALGTAISGLAAVYWGKSSELLQASYILACELVISDEDSSDKSKAWAEANMLKYTFATEAIEQCIANTLS